MDSSVASHSYFIQLEKQSLILESLSNSDSCLKAEKRSALSIKSFQPLRKDSKHLGKHETDDVVKENAKLVFLKLAVTILII